MTPLRGSKRTKIIPDNIFAWRKKNKLMLEINEHRRGDSLKRALAIQRVVEIFKQQKNNGKLTLKRFHNQARAIDLMLTMLTDEYLQAKRKQNAADKEWNDTYLHFFWAFRKEIPKELQREMLRQIREE